MTIDYNVGFGTLSTDRVLTIQGQQNQFKTELVFNLVLDLVYRNLNENQPLKKIAIVNGDTDPQHCLEHLAKALARKQGLSEDQAKITDMSAYFEDQGYNLSVYSPRIETVHWEDIFDHDIVVVDTLNNVGDDLTEFDLVHAATERGVLVIATDALYPPTKVTSRTTPEWLQEMAEEGVLFDPPQEGVDQHVINVTRNTNRAYLEIISERTPVLTRRVALDNLTDRFWQVDLFS